MGSAECAGGCVVGTGDKCVGDDGKHYKDGYHACFDQCWPECQGNKWICVHGDWAPKGKCSSGGDSTSGDASTQLAYTWSVFRDASYTRLGKMPQSRMKDACAELGATPVKIEDEAENNFVRQLCGADGPCWIGLAEPPHSEKWLWMDGSTPSYINW